MFLKNFVAVLVSLDTKSVGEQMSSEAFKGAQQMPAKAQGCLLV